MLLHDDDDGDGDGDDNWMRQSTITNTHFAHMVVVNSFMSNAM